MKPLYSKIFLIPLTLTLILIFLAVSIPVEAQTTFFDYTTNNDETVNLPSALNEESNFTLVIQASILDYGFAQIRLNNIVYISWEKDFYGYPSNLDLLRVYNDASSTNWLSVTSIEYYPNAVIAAQHQYNGSHVWRLYVDGTFISEDTIYPPSGDATTIKFEHFPSYPGNIRVQIQLTSEAVGFDGESTTSTPTPPPDVLGGLIERLAPALPATVAIIAGTILGGLFVGFLGAFIGFNISFLICFLFGLIPLWGLVPMFLVDALLIYGKVETRKQ